MIENHSSLSKLSSPVHLYPQLLKNVRVVDKRAVAQDANIQQKVKEINQELGDEGRILLRESGTEPVIRIMVEADDKSLCQKYINDVYALIKKGGYVCEQD
jgi:phosphoglucosamine mutase